MNSQAKTVLITGVTGFSGRYLADFLLRQGYRVIGACRKMPSDSRIEFFQISNLDGYTHWEPALQQVGAVIHLAARVHQMRDRPENEHLYFSTNVDATISLAQQAAAVGVGKFIYASSVKAMGEGGDGLIYDEKTVCRPEDAHGRSKFKAEVELEKISVKSGLPVVILRPPLMYGPGVKGNMAGLIRLVRRLPFLPLAGIENRRSFLGVGNFAAAVQAVLESERVDSGTYLLSDGESISTSELVNRMIEVFSPGCRNIALPQWFWKIMRRVPLAKARVERLTGSLAVDSSAFCRDLGWVPPFTMQKQFEEMR